MQDAAHDSGTEAADAGEEPERDDPKTETTLTTRVRINIPGSRPIPPVVVRKPVEDADADAVPAPGPTSSATGSSAAASASLGVPPPADEPRAMPGGSGEGKKEETKTSDWFAPRKPPASASSPPPAPPPAGPPPAGLPRRPDVPYRPDSSGPGAPDEGVRGSEPPYDTDQGTESTPAFGTGVGSVAAGPEEDAGPADAAGPVSFVGSAGPAGPTTGPMTGEMPLPPSGFLQTGGAGLSDDTQELIPQSSAPTAPTAPDDQRPSASGIGAVGPGPAGSAADDPAPGGPADDVSGDTLVGGIPRVPASGGSPFPGSATAGRPAFPSGPPFGQDGEPHGASAPAPRTSPPVPAKAGKKGRSKAVLAVAGLVGLAAVAYGAGLLLDHADVPNGTTVLGVDIGGMSKEEAVKRLDGALGERGNGALTVIVEGEEQQLKPSAAGLSIDTWATVRSVAGRDYNPVSVIGSLFGGAREAEPEIEVDEEKLTAALKALSAELGAAQEGTIKFVPGKAVAVPGRPHNALDLDESVTAVETAYHERAETGRNGAIDLPVSMQQPTISQTEIDRKMKEFAEPAMSGLVTIKAGNTSIPFGPDKSLPKILSMKVVDGRLVEVYNREVLKELYGSTFDGVLIQKGDGTEKPVSPEDVAQALSKALRGKTPAERIGIIPLNPS